MTNLRILSTWFWVRIQDSEIGIQDFRLEPAFAMANVRRLRTWEERLIRRRSKQINKQKLKNYDRGFLDIGNKLKENPIAE